MLFQLALLSVFFRFAFLPEAQVRQLKHENDSLKKQSDQLFVELTGIKDQLEFHLSRGCCLDPNAASSEVKPRIDQLNQELVLTAAASNQNLLLLQQHSPEDSRVLPGRTGGSSSSSSGGSCGSTGIS